MALLEAVHDFAKAEVGQMQAVVEDALRQHSNATKTAKGRGREHGVTAYLESTEIFQICRRSFLS